MEAVKKTEHEINVEAVKKKKKKRKGKDSDGMEALVG